jgi:hypothetical protein
VNDAEQNLTELFEEIQEAELVANRAQFEKEFQLLHCEELGDVPIRIMDKFSCVLDATFHAMDRVKLPIRHAYKKAFKVAMMRAFMEYEPFSLEKVKITLRDRGWSDENIDATMFYNPSYFNRSVERIALPPRQLYYMVRAVFVTFGKRKDSKTGQPLFYEESWKKAKNLLHEISEGLYSDPPGSSLYTYEVDRDGNVKKDSQMAFPSYFAAGGQTKWKASIVNTIQCFFIYLVSKWVMLSSGTSSSQHGSCSAKIS